VRARRERQGRKGERKGEGRGGRDGEGWGGMGRVAPQAGGDPAPQLGGAGYKSPSLLHCVSRKHPRIFIKFGRSITEKVRNQKMLYFSTLPNPIATTLRN